MAKSKISKLNLPPLECGPKINSVSIFAVNGNSTTFTINVSTVYTNTSILCRTYDINHNIISSWINVGPLTSTSQNIVLNTAGVCYVDFQLYGDCIECPSSSSISLISSSSSAGSSFVSASEAASSSAPSEATSSSAPSEIVESSAPSSSAPSEIVESSAPSSSAPSEVVESSAPSEVVESSAPSELVQSSAPSEATSSSSSPSEIISSSFGSSSISELSGPSAPCGLAGTVYDIAEFAAGPFTVLQSDETLSSLTPYTVIYPDNFDYYATYDNGYPGVPNLTTYFQIKFIGKITLPATGSYTFRLQSDDGSRLYINNTLYINNDGVHDFNSMDSTTYNLTAGSYDFRLDYFQGPINYIGLKLYWRLPETNDFVIIPAEAFECIQSSSSGSSSASSSGSSSGSTGSSSSGSSGSSSSNSGSSSSGSSSGSSNGSSSSISASEGSLGSSEGSMSSNESATDLSFGSSLASSSNLSSSFESSSGSSSGPTSSSEFSSSAASSSGSSGSSASSGSSMTSSGSSGTSATSEFSSSGSSKYSSSSEQIPSSEASEEGSTPSFSDSLASSSSDMSSGSSGYSSGGSSSGSGSGSGSSGPCCEDQWDGVGVLDVRDACPESQPEALFLGNCNTWTATKQLSKGSFTMTITSSCETGVGCDSWSAEVSTSCPEGSAEIQGILSECSEFSPPLWQIIFDPGLCDCIVWRAQVPYMTGGQGVGYCYGPCPSPLSGPGDGNCTYLGPYRETMEEAMDDCEGLPLYAPEPGPFGECYTVCVPVPHVAPDINNNPLP